LYRSGLSKHRRDKHFRGKYSCRTAFSKVNDQKSLEWPFPALWIMKKTILTIINQNIIRKIAAACNSWQRDSFLMYLQKQKFPKYSSAESLKKKLPRAHRAQTFLLF
jgi:hypothetical protein